MKAARFYEVGQRLRIEDVPIPKIGEFDVLLRIRACGCCHSDLHVIDGHVKPGKIPMTLGHEMAGEVAEMGTRVERVRQGDRVLFYYVNPCRECYYCKTGRENLCLNPAWAGFFDDGGYAEYIRALASNLVHLPDSIPYEKGAPLACGGGTSFHALKVANVSLGNTVLVYGVGGLGLYAVQLATLSGASVIAVDIYEEKLDLARKFGAKEVINATEQDVPEEVKRFTDGLGCDVVFEYVSTAKTGENALMSLKKGGTFVSIGVSGEYYRVDPLYILQNELKIMGINGFTQQELVELVKMVQSGKVKSMISKVYKLSEVNEALEEVRSHRVLGRVVVRP